MFLQFITNKAFLHLSQINIFFSKLDTLSIKTSGGVDNSDVERGQHLVGTVYVCSKKGMVNIFSDFEVDEIEFCLLSLLFKGYNLQLKSSTHVS